MSENINDDYKKIVESVESESSDATRIEQGKANMERFRPDEAQTADFHLGYHVVPVTSLPSSGMFYPDNTEVSIRAAKVTEVRHFSSIDEHNILDVDAKLNAIMESCVRITSKKSRLSYKDLCEEDRFYIILSVRDLTFPEPESNLTVEHKDKKGKKHTFDIDKKYFQYFNIPEELDKYYSDEEKTFLIETKSFGTIKMRPPSIGIMQQMTGYIKDKQEEGIEIDQSVLQIMPYVVSEWRGFNKTKIFEFELEMNGWSTTKYSLIYKLAEKMKIGVQPNMAVTLDDGEDIEIPINFRDGIKSLFIVQDFSGELL